MSGVLHPEGPEPAQTYWLRRALVLVALLILVLVSVGVAGAMGATRQGASAGPAAVPSAIASATTSDATSSVSPGSSASSAGTGSTGSPRPSATTSSAVDKADKTAGKTGPAAAAIPSCSSEDLALTIAGKQMLKVNKPAAFTVTVRNDGDAACRVNLTRSVFELKVTTGKKLLWSSRACTTATFLVAAKLDLDQSMSWAMLWDGRGLAAGCTQPGRELKRGTYLTTATLTGVKPAELPVTLRP